MNRIKIAIVGVNFGRWIVEALTTPGIAHELFELVAVCDLDPERARSMAEKADVEAFTDLDALLAREEIAAIGLFTGPAGRAALLRKIMDAGKDVITTKPFEVDPEAAGEILQYARDRGRVLHLNSPAPLLPPDLRQIQTWEKEYALGKPVGCRADVWASYREQADGTWLDDPQKCPVAPIFRLGIYLINDLVRLWGEADCVQVLHSRLFTERPTPDNAQLGIRFANGALANIFASFGINDDQYYSNALTLNYENGTIYRNVGQLAFGGGKTNLTLVAKTKNGETVQATCEYSDGSGLYQWESFYRAINGEKLSDEVSPQVIVDGLRVIHAMTRASLSGASERV